MEPQSLQAPLRPTPVTHPPSCQQRPANGTCRVHWISDLDALSKFAQPWDTLARNASEPNVFYESWYLLPALRHLQRSEKVSVALVYQAGTSGASEDLIGLFPLRRVTPIPGLPIRMLQLWKHDQCFLATPLLQAGKEQQCWDSLLTHLDQRATELYLDLPCTSADGPVFDGLSRCLARCGREIRISHVYARPQMTLRSSADEYFSIDSSPPKEYAAKRRKLERTGPVQAFSLSPGGDWRSWLNEFLRLEEKGWKGAARTALACNAEDLAFITEVAGAAHERNRLMMFALRHRGQTIAMQLDLLGTKHSAFALKVAYDEDYDRYSPGVLLELEAIRMLHCEGRTRWLDSCCAPRMDSGTAGWMNRLWNRRRTLVSATVPVSGILPKLGLCALPLARYAKRLVRRLQTSQPCPA